MFGIGGSNDFFMLLILSFARFDSNGLCTWGFYLFVVSNWFTGVQSLSLLIINPDAIALKIKIWRGEAINFLLCCVLFISSRKFKTLGMLIFSLALFN